MQQVKTVAYLVFFVVFVILAFKHMGKEDVVVSQEDSSIYEIGYMKKGAYWTNDIKILPELKSILNDSEELQRLINENKIYRVKMNTVIELSRLPNGFFKIKFKEGKDTDKIAYTLKSFTTYGEISSEQVKAEFVQKAMLSAVVIDTDDYDIPIQEGNLNKAKENKKKYDEYLITIKRGYESKNISDIKNEVINILNWRIHTLDDYISYVRCYQKGLRDSTENYKNLMYENWQKAEDTRRLFEGEYGIEYKKDKVIVQSRKNNVEEEKIFQSELKILSKYGYFPEGLEITIPVNTPIILGDELSSNLVRINQNTKAVVKSREKLKNKSANIVEILEGKYAGQSAIIFRTDYILSAKSK